MRNIEAISTAALLKMEQTPEVAAELDRRGELLTGISRRPESEPDGRQGNLFNLEPRREDRP